MKSSNIFGFTFIILIIIFSSSSLFFSYLNPASVNNIAYGSSSSSSSSLSGQNQQLIDKIAIKVTEAKPSADYVSVKKVIEGVASQKHNTGGNVQESLTNILNQVSQNPESIVVDNIVNLALKEGASNTQQQNQVTPQPTNDLSNRNDTKVSDKALEIGPNATYALYNEGRALYDLGRYDESIQYADKALQIDPNYTLALKGKGSALSSLGKYDEAIQNFDQILAMNASDATAINSKAFTLAQMGKNEEGLSVIEKAVQDNPNNEYLQSTMAFILANLGREDEARTL